MLCIFFILWLCEILYLRIACKYRIIDHPGSRSSHQAPALRGGGIIFLMGVWVWAGFYGINYPWFMLGLTAVGAVSFADDIHPQPTWLRLVVHFAGVALMFVDLGLYTWSLGLWLLAPALILGVGIINAYNFMDGINGITGAYSLAVLAPLIYLNTSLGFIDGSFLKVTLLSVVVFSFYNFRNYPRCFAGDVGSLCIAFILLFALARLILFTGDAVYLLFLAVYGVDSVLTIVHRIMLRENLGRAHRKHAYQIMVNELRMPHLLISAMYMTLQLGISAGLLLIHRCRWWYFAAVITLLSVAYVLFMRKYYRLHKV